MGKKNLNDGKYIAHKKDGEIQTIEEHSLNTASYCEEFAIEPLKTIAKYTGLLHDIGKYQSKFQKRINGENVHVEHSVCGALESEKIFEEFPDKLIAEYCIAGHHTGLPDGGNKSDTCDMTTLNGRMKREPESYECYKNDLHVTTIKDSNLINILSNGTETKEELIDKFAFFTRYIFSCLTDADSKDTSEFYNGKSDDALMTDYNKCLELINRRLDEFINITALQRARTELQKHVFENSKINSDVYVINMPTGSGKTITSMKIALEKAIEHKKKRIIYVIPYNSIIDQTMNTFEALFGDQAEILRHQSTFDYDESEYTEDYARKAKLAMENWEDETIIITTAVQFFESIFKNKRSRLRKLHNMQDSIIVFDEVHLLPIEYLQPCIQAISYITKYLNTKAVFLSATMPDFQRIFKKYALKDTKLETLVKSEEYFSPFKKCTYINMGAVTSNELFTESAKHSSSLIIVNKKISARDMYNQSSGKKFHLSTYMTAYDREKTIAEINIELEKLEQNNEETDLISESEKITIVSTSLIEAGVDMDLHAVFREIAGLDSILQSGGRCNREGLRENGEVYIFSYKDNDNSKTTVKESITKGLIDEYDDISSKECIEEFYERLYSLNENEIKKNTISRNTTGLDNIPFKTYADNFNLISADKISVIIPEDSYSRNLIDEMESGNYISCLNRKLQKYSCSISEPELKSLMDQGVVEYSDYGFWYLTNDSYYNRKTGIQFDAADYYI